MSHKNRLERTESLAITPSPVKPQISPDRPAGENGNGVNAVFWLSCCQEIVNISGLCLS
jgi:hypothetical protein